MTRHTWLEYGSRPRRISRALSPGPRGGIELALSLLAAIPFLITSGKPSEPLQLAGQAVWAYVTVVFTLDNGYKLYNDLHAKKFSLVPGQQRKKTRTPILLPTTLWVAGVAADQV